MNIEKKTDTLSKRPPGMPGPAEILFNSPVASDSNSASQILSGKSTESGTRILTMEETAAAESPENTGILVSASESARANLVHLNGDVYNISGKTLRARANAYQYRFERNIFDRINADPLYKDHFSAFMYVAPALPTRVDEDQILGNQPAAKGPKVLILSNNAVHDEAFETNLELPRKILQSLACYLNYVGDLNHQGRELFKELTGGDFDHHVLSLVPKNRKTDVGGVAVKYIYAYIDAIDKEHAFGIGPVIMVSMGGRDVVRVSSQPTLVYSDNIETVKNIFSLIYKGSQEFKK